MRDSGTTVDALVVGAGFAGMYAIHKLRQLGLKVRAFEAADDVGGTWWWNRYPGARCDVESMEYSYSFSEELQQEWQWTEKYATQAEILAYARHAADHMRIRDAIQFSTKVLSAHFDSATSLWTVGTDRGDCALARMLIMAAGCLSQPQFPDLPGLKQFSGRVLHTGQWPHEPVDFRSQRVGIVGTGSSGIQLIPEVAKQAAHLTVFQRTPNFSLPAFNRPLAQEDIRWFKRHYAARREKARYTPGGSSGFQPPDRAALDDSPERREKVYEQGWQKGSTALLRNYRDILTNEQSNATLAEFVRSKISKTVHEPEVAALLTPTDHPIGTKRVCLDNGYYETFNRANVRLVNLRSQPILKMTPNGVMAGGEEIPLDNLVFATGYDAITGAVLSIDVRVDGGLALAHKWKYGARAYLGLMTAGFPNLFLITGPGSPSVLANMITGIEQHVEWIADCLAFMREHLLTRIDADPAHEDAWVEHVDSLASATLLPRTNSWFTGANVPGKPRVFLPYSGGHGTYRMKCSDVAFRRYEGFIMG